jgi:hypothetical protein
MTCATCPISLPCFSGYVALDDLGICYHCCSVVLYDGHWDQVAKHECGNLAQLERALHRPFSQVTRMKTEINEIYEYSVLCQECRAQGRRSTMDRIFEAEQKDP